MHVAMILTNKGRDVVTARSGETVGAVAERLIKNRIGAVVVCDAPGRIAGIVSERDVMWAFSADPAGAAAKPVADIMTKRVVTCTEHDTLDELMGLMTTHRFRHLPVVADGKLVGIISIGDVVKHHIAEIEMEASAMREYIASG